MYRTKENKSGISLIVLVITIIVVVIVAAAVILTLTDNNPIEEARKATFLSDVEAFKSELDMYNTTQYATTMGNYDIGSLNASVAAGNIYTVIPSLEKKTKYLNHFEVIGGTLYYTGEDEEEIEWAATSGGIASAKAKPEVTLTTSNTIPVKAGGSVAYTVGMNATIPITVANLSGNIKVLNNAGAELGTQPSINIGAVSGTTADKERSATVTINTTGMADGEYKIKILAEAVQTAGSKSLEVVSTATFEIDSTAPSMPTITINPTTWTNGNVTATLTKSNATDTLEYSTNGTTWTAYTTPVTITSNLTVYARETDSANNVSNQASQIISIIDKTSPIAAWGTPSKTTMTNADTVTIPLTFTETGSGMKASTINATNVTIQKTGITAATVNLSGSGNSYTATVSGITGTGSFTLTATTAITDNANNVIGSNVVSSTITVATPFATVTFTNAGATGKNGPTQAHLNTTYASTSLAGLVTTTNGIQVWTVPYTGTYRIETYGAQGGTANYAGGQGTIMKGDFNLTQGQQLKILVGQMGLNTYNAAGGGGGTFVQNYTTTSLLIASGGGGGGSNTIGLNALATTTGGSDSGSNTPSSENGGAGMNGGGGGGGSGYGSGGGAGYSGNGGAASYNVYSTSGGTGGNNSNGGNAIGGGVVNTSGGISFLNGGTGGYGVSGYSSQTMSEGGFGGGGSGPTGNILGGGGGGYSGGAGAGYNPGSHRGGYGGGSYNSGANQSNSVGNTGHGKVIINKIG